MIVTTISHAFTLSLIRFNLDYRLCLLAAIYDSLPVAFGYNLREHAAARIDEFHTYNAGGEL